MCYYLCVLRWLIRPILALNCLLQIEQERSEEESSVSDALALAFAVHVSALFLKCRISMLSPFYIFKTVINDPMVSAKMAILNENIKLFYLFLI